MHLLRRYHYLKPLIPVVSTGCFVLLFRLISALAFDFPLHKGGLLWDYGFALWLSTVFFCFSRRISLFLVVQCLFLGFCYISHAIKYAFFGVPIIPDDIYALKEALEVMSSLELFYFFAPVAIFIVIVLFNLRFTWKRSVAGLSLLAAFLVPVIAFPHNTAQFFSTHLWFNLYYQQTNYQMRGPILYSYHETARYLESRTDMPTQEAVAHAAQTLYPHPLTTPTTPSKPRNIYLIIVESLWDVARLTKAQLSQDPFDPRLRALWEKSGGRMIASPTFGGKTANAEFEALCGFPKFRQGIIFQQAISPNALCLPRVLTALGYHTQTYHGNAADFWNRRNTYRKLGFNHIFELKDFDRSDIKGMFLPDYSFFRQVYDTLGHIPTQQGLNFHYLLTISTHRPYALNADQPNVITSNAKESTVNAFANAVYYTTRSISDFIEKVQKTDPDALIIAFGDHLPYLGMNYAGYRESGLLTHEPEGDDIHWHTPFIFIDGKEPNYKLPHNISMYELPSLILERIGATPNVFSYQLASTHIRPTDIGTLAWFDNNTHELCREDSTAPSPACTEVLGQMKQLNILEEDGIFGIQHLCQVHSFPGCPQEH